MTGSHDPVPEGNGPHPAPRIAFVISLVVYSGFSLNALIYVLAGENSLGGIALAVACLAGLMALQAGVMGREVFRRSSGAGLAVLAVQCVLVYAPLPLFGWVWLGTPVFVAGSVLLVLRPAVLRWTVFAGVCVLSWYLVTVLSPDRIEAVYIALVTAGNGIAFYGLSRLTVLAARLRRAQAELAELSVREERDRFAHEIARSIGSRLDALRSLIERAIRLASTEPVAAAVVVERTIRLARDSQQQVRAVARQLRGSSLDNELGAVRTVLSTAGIDVTVRVPVTVPSSAEPRLVDALRTVVDDLLRHEDVRHCRIGVDVEGDGPRAVVRLEVVHDGCRADEVSPRPDGPPAAEVENLPDGRRRTVLRVGAEDAAADGFSSPSLRRAMSTTLMAPRTVYWLLAAVLTEQLCVAIGWLIQIGAPPAGLAAGVAALLVVMSGPAVHLAGPGRLPRWAPPTALAVQVALVAVLVLVSGSGQSGLFGVVAGCALIALPRRWAAWTGFAVLVAASAVNQAVVDGSPIMIGYGIVAAVNVGLAVYGLSRLGGVVAGLHAARTALAQAAVSRERTRFARDLHDLLGYSFSAAALKAELALHLIGAGGGEPAASELTDVAAVLRRATDDLDGVSLGRRELTLADELASVRTVLASAGVDLVVEGEPPDGLPPDAESDLATLLREAVVNLLRHADATTCRIRTGRDPAWIEIANDGVRPAPAAPPDDVGGSGLANLTCRIERWGGTVTVDTGVPGRFVLTARMPGVPVSPGPAGGLPAAGPPAPTGSLATG